MKQTFTILFILCGAIFNAFAQPRPNYTSSDKKAVKLYEEASAAYNTYDMALAESLLLDAIAKDPNFIEPHILLSQVYVDQRRLDMAAEILDKAIALDPKFFPNNYFFLGELQLLLGQYAEAGGNFTAFLESPKPAENLIERANLGLRSSRFAQEAMAKPVNFSPVNLGSAINSRFSEFYPCLTADGRQLIFTRDIRTGDGYRDGQEDFYLSQRVDDLWQPALPIQDVNTDFNEGAPALTPDGNILIFTACEQEGSWGPGRSGLGRCDLFYSQRSGDRWSQPENLGEKVNSYHWDSQPSISADGRTLYFVRGKNTGPGSPDEQDIWYSTLDDTNMWTKAQKLPGKVNSAFREESVLIHPDGRTLYFSSDGHPGMGGLDIFVSRLQPDGSWGEPENLGYPINTNSDENSLLVDATGSIAYFASNREGGYGGLDLYSFVLPEAIRPVPVTYCSGTVFDKLSFKKLEARFELIDLESGQKVMESYSDPVNGKFLVCLPTGLDYALNVSRQGYLFYSDNFSLGNHDPSKAFELQVPLAKISSGNSVVLNNVFFETDKADLREASRAELNKLVQFLNDNPSLRIEIGGHTDNVGSDDSNQKLSEARALAVVNYLISKGVVANRLQSKGYGELKPVADNSTEKGRARNRRTEFTVLP
jgi:outer membrane protein OmpA-like peptidoglycan-associated protein/tetratricopeptide (TPR) repeat protein